MERRSPLLWPGDKCLLGAEYLSLLRPQRGGRILDPFCGSVGIHMHHEFPLLLGDVDPLLINLLREIQTNPARLQRTFAGITSFSEGVRDLRHDTRPGRAGALLYVNRSSRFPHVRYNREGGYNLGFCRTPVYPEDAVKKLHERLAMASIRHDDYAWVLLKARAGDVVLFDPPYIETGGMYCSDNGIFNYRVLAKNAELLRERNARVVFTLNVCEEARKHLSGADDVLTLRRRGSERLAGHPQFEFVAIYDRSLQRSKTETSGPASPADAGDETPGPFLGRP